MSTQLVSVVDRAIEERCARRGFRKVANGVFVVDIGSPDVRGWLSVALASHKRGGEVDADPMIGVRLEPVERLVPTSAAHEATVFRPLYELLDDDYVTWTFNEYNRDEQADALIDLIEEVARPFMRSLATWDAIERALLTWAFADVRRVRLPALRLARDGQESARTVVDAETSLLEREGDAVGAQQYRDYATALLRVDA